MSTEYENDRTPSRRPAQERGARADRPSMRAGSQPYSARPSVAGSRRVHGSAHSPSGHRPDATGSARPYRPSAQGANGSARAPHSTQGYSRAEWEARIAQRDATRTGGTAQQQGYTPLWDEKPPIGPRISRRTLIAGGAVAAIAVAAFGVVPFVRGLLPVTVTVNGQEVKLSGERTLQAAYAASGVQTTPGNLVDIEGEILTEGGGQPYIAMVNGQEAADDVAIEDGDVLAFADGNDVEEPSVTEDRTTDPDIVESGNGPVHAISSQGTQGLSTVKTGQTSGKEIVLEVKQETQDRVYAKTYVDTGGEKAIALTFDDGPWEDSTAAILDVLRDNGAAATFFTVGERIAGAGVDLVKREHDEGHQVCTHTWDHAAGSGQGVNMSFMTPEEQRAEIEKGYQAISDATGAEASRVFRSPGGNFPIEVWRNVEDLIEAEIGWNIDTLDWKRPGADVIAERIKGAAPGNIVLMHDGGGDRSQTVEALRKALPELKEQGFRFVTMDELLQFPRTEG